MTDSNASNDSVVEVENAIKGTIARRAGDFLNTLGVVAHLSAKRYADAGTATIQQDLDYLGFKNVRTNVGRDDVVDVRRALAKNGINFNYTVLKPASGSGIPTVKQIKSAIDNRIADITDNNLQSSTASLEPFNEYNNSDTNNNNPNWDDVVRAATSYLHDQTHAAFGLAVKILGPAMIGKDLATAAPKVGDISANINFGNLHSYYGGDNPESNYPDEASTFVKGTCSSLALLDNPAGTFDKRLALLATCMSKDKPVVITEMGYHNDPTSTTHKYTSERAAGIYMPRAYLEAFRIGIKKTYAYELYDEPGTDPPYEQHFGFYREDGTKKPSAIAVHRLTKLLADAGATRNSFAPGKLNFTLTGTAEAMNNLHKILFQKSDGSFWLALWEGVSVWKVGATTDHEGNLSPSDQSLTLALSSAANATTYDIGDSVTGTPLGRHDRFHLLIGPTVNLIKIVP